MLRTALVGLDRALYSDAVVELALQWAHRFEARIMALGVVDETVVGPSAVPVGAGEFKEELDADLLAKARQWSADSLKKLDDRCRREQVRYVLKEETGVPHEQIVLYAQRCDLVLLPNPHAEDETFGESARETLKTVLRSSPRPVVAVPEGPPSEGAVLVAYDGSLQAARTLYGFVASGLGDLGPVYVLSIDGRSAETAAERANRAVEYLAAHEIAAVAWPRVSHEAVGEVVLAEAERLGTALLVLGAHARGVLVEFLIGSVTANVLSRANVPVFLFH